MAYENEGIEALSYEDGKQVLDDEELWLATIAANTQLIDSTIKKKAKRNGTYVYFGLSMYGDAADAIRRLSSSDYPIRFADEIYLVEGCHWDTVWKHWNVTLVKYH